MAYLESATAFGLATSPVILVSAVGLLLLTMNNRLAHSLDRARSLRERVRHATPDECDNLEQQIEVIWSRSRTIKRGIESAAVSGIGSLLLVVTLFLRESFGIAIPYAPSILFIFSLVAFITALALLILDVHRSLQAINLELWPDGTR